MDRAELDSAIDNAMSGPDEAALQSLLASGA
jgi:hypothetical protein